MLPNGVRGGNCLGAVDAIQVVMEMFDVKGKINHMYAELLREYEEIYFILDNLISIDIWSPS